MRPRAVRAPLAGLLLVAGACIYGGDEEDELGLTAVPIIGGFETSGDPAVVFTNTTTGNCTGTLISPRVILTAAHCIHESIGAGHQGVGSVGFGSEMGSFDKTVGIADLYAHRYYEPEVIRRYDIGLIRLAEPVGDIDPVPFNEVPLGPDDLGAEVRVIGFGVTDGETQTGAGKKRQVDLTIDQLSAEHIGLGGDQRNICQGDSGGPTLMEIGGTEYVLAVSSFTSNFCRNRSYVTRTDIYADMLREVMAAWDGPCAWDGECVTEGCGEFPDPDCDPCGLNGFCARGCERLDLDCPVAGFAADPCVDGDGCESRVCLEAPEDERVKYCSLRCDASGGGGCPDPISDCRAGPDGEHYCYYPGLSPGVQGASCRFASDCRSGICDNKHDMCIEPCGEEHPPCGEEFECRGVGDGIHACRLPGGGCRAAEGGGTLAALLFLGFLLTRRRSRVA